VKPTRHEVVNGRLIEEFYWNSRRVVYIDNKRTSLTYDAAKNEAQPHDA